MSILKSLERYQRHQEGIRVGDIKPSRKNVRLIKENGVFIGDGYDGLFGNPPYYQDYSLEGYAVRVTKTSVEILCTYTDVKGAQV